MSLSTPTPTEPPAPVSGTSPPGPTPASVPSPVPAPRSRRWLTPLIAVVVAAVVIIAVLAAAGFLFHKSNSTITEAFATLSEAESVAGPAASHALTGSWSPVFAAGIHLNTGLSLPVLNLTTLTNLTSGCTLASIAGAPTLLTVDATPISALPGHAAFWLIGLSNGAGTVALVAVDLGTASPLYTVTGSSCAGGALGELVAFPSSESDSPALVAAANASGGASFLGANPTAAQFFVGVGGVTVSIVTLPPTWEVVDTSCPLPLLLNVTGAEFNATLSGAPATVELHASGPVNCAAGLGSSLPKVTLLAAPLLAVAKAI